MNNNQTCFMRTAILKRAWRAFGQAHFIPQSRGVIVMIALLLAAASLSATPTVNWISGGPNTGYPSGAGFVDGDITLDAEYHTPCGLAIDSTANYLYVADRDNNAVRVLQFDVNTTYHIEFEDQNGNEITNIFNKPVGVALDNSDNLLFVLNRGKGTNGSVLEIDFANGILATNLTKITNAGGITVDSLDNIYVTASNKVFKVAPSGVSNVVATVTASGASLQGIVFKHNGLLAVCDTGRNGILLIDPTTGVITTNAGFHGAGDFFSANNVAPSNTARFFQPTGVAETGDGTLIVSDYGNHRVKAVLANGIVTNLYGVTSNDWVKPYKGFVDGTVVIPDKPGGVAARLPFGVVFANDGSVYTTEDYYHIIRKITGTGLLLPPTPPPPPPPPPPPSIGWFDYEGNNLTGFFSVFYPVTSSVVFNNDKLLAVNPNTNGVSTYYINGPSPLTSLPSSTNGSTPPFYQNGLTHVQTLPVTTTPDLVVEAINVNSVGEGSPVVTAEFIFQVANPLIIGNNGAQFTVSDITTNVTLWYTLDGTSPTNAPPSYGPILLTNSNPVTLSLNVSSNILFQARAFRNGYEPSGIGAQSFSPSNFVPNSISFGFASGEASSAFVASPGQTFYAPVTLSILPGTVMDSLQFTLTVNSTINIYSFSSSAPITPGAFAFQSMLMKPDLDNPGYVMPIPPYMFIANAAPPPPPGQIVTYEDTNFVNLVTTNLSLNLLGVGWLERQGQTNLFNTLSQNLLTMSMAHDDLFPTAAQPNGVIVGGYTFQVPANAAPGDTYQIQIGRPSATTDGIGEPGSSVFVFAPTNGSYGAGTINAIKNVTVGQLKYIAGDVYPFSWFNAGDFGKGYLAAPDVAQVFEAAVYGLNAPPPGSDLFDAMDSCGYTYVDNGYGYLQPSGVLANTSLLFNGNDATIDQIAFGDGQLDVADVYVTFRRSLQTNLVWFRRYWTNDVAHGVSGRVAEIVPNVAPSVVTKSLSTSKSINAANSGNFPISITNQPQVNFAAGDCQTNAGSTIQIPITANIFGNYPLRVLMLNLSVVPLDGSPLLTTPISFSPNTALGQPTSGFTSSRGNGNYAAAWLNSGIAGISNNATLGTLTVTIPANVTSLSAYAIHFDHASASPNGIASFPKQTLTGVITLSSRTNSTYGDGIPDLWRLRWFGTVNNILSVSNACPSGDGIDNWQKYIAGVDPNMPNDFPSLNPKAPVPAGATAAIHWPTVSGIQYVVLRSSSLFPGSWSAIATNTGTGTDMEFDDTTTSQTRFYRVQILP
jgi:hypothetical protein